MELCGTDERIAAALSDVLKTPLMRDWVEVKKSRIAGRYEVTTVFEDVMARVRPYTDPPGWTAMAEPALIGYELDGSPCYLCLDGHGMITGKQGSGKSSLMDVCRAHRTRAGAIWWGGGVQKVYEGYAGWIDPFRDTDVRPPIDWVVNGPRDVLDMLLAAMRVIRYRQSIPMNRRDASLPTLIVEIDEANTALSDTSVWGEWDGSKATIGSLAAMIARAGRSARVRLVVASQSGIPTEWGPQGAIIAANMNWKAVFRSGDEAEVGRALGWAAYKKTQPRFVGQCWLRVDNEDPKQVKTLYLHTMDPLQPKLHNGLTVADVARARSARCVELDAGSATAAGEAYGRRHLLVDADMQAYLTGCFTAPASDQGQARPVIPQARAAYEQALAEVAALKQSGQEDAADPAGVTSLTGRRTREERVMEIACAAPESMTAGEIVTALREAGDTTAEEPAVRALLSKLVTKGALSQPDRGKYAAQ